MGVKRTTTLSLLSIIASFALLLTGFQETPAQGEPPPALIEASPGEGYVSGEVLVKFKPGITRYQTAELQRELNAVYAETVFGTTVQRWQVASGEESQAVKRLNADPAVEYAELNYLVRELATYPNDPHFAQQWAYTTTNAIQAWDITTGTGVIIAILDSGIDETHPDLADKIWVNTDEIPGNSIDDDGNGKVDDTWGWDFVSNDNQPHDERGHGTLVAGVAAAVTNNATGIAGMSWGGEIMPIRITGIDGTGDNADIAAGIAYACANGAQVINISVGSNNTSATVEDAVRNARANGCLVVAAMGNERKTGNPTYYPAGYAQAMAVSATGFFDVYTFYSQYGDHVDIAAPGGDMTSSHPEYGIFSTMPTYAVPLNDSPYNMAQDYDYAQGTSLAAPHVTGLAALIWSIDPTLTVTDVQTIIETTAVDKGARGWDPDYGHGRINTRAALEVAAQYSSIYLPLTLRNYIPGSGWTRTIIEDFESDFPASWTVTQTVSGSGEYLWGKRSRTCEVYRGNYSGWAVGGGADGSLLACGSNYPDNINSEMIFGPFSLANVSEAVLTFQVWLYSQSGADEFRYRASKDGVDFTGWVISGNTNGWRPYSIDFSKMPAGGGTWESWIGETNVWIKFRFTTDSSTNYMDGVLIDDIILHTCNTGC